MLTLLTNFKIEHEVTEKITYTNTDGLQMVFSSEPPFLYSTKDGFETPENIVNLQRSYGQDGATQLNAQVDVRELSINGIIKGKDKADLAFYRRQLIQVLNPKVAGTLTYENEHGTYELDVIPQFAPQINEGAYVNSPSIDEYRLMLLALDPYWTDKSEIDAEIPMAREENLFEFPLEITNEFEFSRMIAGDVIEIQNNGDVAVGAVFTINANGILKNPRLYNVITQEYFALNGTFTTGTKLRISTLRGKKRVEEDTGDGQGYKNIMTKRKVESTFLQIDRGINYLQLQADEGVEFTTSYIRFEPKILGV